MDIRKALALHQTGRIAEAQAAYKAILKRAPRNSDAWHFLGIVHAQLGQPQDAVKCIEKAVALAPDHVEAHFNLGSVLVGLNRHADAIRCFERVVALDPGNVEARNNLGCTLAILNRHQEAIPHFDVVVTAKPQDAEAGKNLGNSLMAAGRYQDAIGCFDRVVVVRPEDATAHNSLGSALAILNRHQEAMRHFERAIAISPDFAEARYNLGTLLSTLTQRMEAIRHLERATAIAPDYADAHFNLGNALAASGRYADAIQCFGRVIAIEPGDAAAHNELGATLAALDMHDEAIRSYEKALAIKPDYAKAHCNLGNTFSNLGRPGEAEASYRRAMQIKPEVLQYAVQAHLQLPIIPTLADISVWRAHYEAGISYLMNAPGSLDDVGEIQSVSFYLAYHNRNDRPIMESLCRLFRARVSSLTFTASHTKSWRPPAVRSQRIRIGFLSQFLADHTIGKLFQGFIRHLDRGRFEVVAIHAPMARHDTVRQAIDALSDRVLDLPAGLADQQRAVGDEQLDVLFYPDIGMAPSTYFLAFARLAPVQAVSWGHPDTTGLDTIDYFMSSSAIESEHAEDHYTERLVRLNRLPCFYQTPIAPTQVPTRAAFHLPDSGTLYGCPQTLFKFHPDFDAVLAAIAEGDSTGRIVLLEDSKNKALTELLKARWEKTFPILLDRVLFLPRMPFELFMAFITHMDVLLDPVHFGSGNTLYEAMAHGTPVVTWPGQFMRARIVAGAYLQMEVADAPIATQLDGYAPLALALGQDEERRGNFRAACRQAAGQALYEDMQVVREFEDFLDAAVAAAARGQKLPIGWRPGNAAKRTGQES